MSERMGFTEMVSELKKELFLQEKYKDLESCDADLLAEEILTRMKSAILDHNLS